jgi:sugar-specific transcriptional regulator TrmB
MYLTSHWPQVASIIAKKRNIKRASIYTVLQSMVNKWLLVDYTKNKVTYFKWVEPEDITILFKKKELELKKLA